MSEAPFVSTLSTGALLALADAGFRSLKQVQGTSVVSLGYQQKPSHRVRRALAPVRIDSPTGGASLQVYYPRGSATVQQYLNEGGWSELEGRTAAFNSARTRSEERRVGKECRSRWSPYH